MRIVGMMWMVRMIFRHTETRTLAVQSSSSSGRADAAAENTYLAFQREGGRVERERAREREREGETDRERKRDR